MSFNLQVDIAIVGSSYIFKLLKYIDREGEKDVLGKIDRVFNLYKENINVQFRGKSGGVFKDLQKLAFNRGSN